MTVSTTSGVGAPARPVGDAPLASPDTPSPRRPLGIDGFSYADLYDAAKLRELLDVFDRWFGETAPGPRAQFEAYRSSKGAGMTPLQRSEALIAAAPFVGRFVGKLFGVEEELERFRDGVRKNDPIWRFRKDFVKKRVLRADAAKGWSLGVAVARDAAKVALQSVTAAPIGGTTDEEATIAAATLQLLEVDDVARKAAKAGGAQWTDALRARARNVRDAVAPYLASVPGASSGTGTLAAASEDEGASLGRAVAFALEAIEAWLAATTTRFAAGRRCACRSRSTTRTSSRSSVRMSRCRSCSSARPTSGGSGSASR
jgi:hypothetical protein